MKKVIFALAAILMAVCSSCSDLDEAMLDQGESIPVRIDGGISQVATRASVDGFYDNDVVGIYVVNYTDQNMKPGILRNVGNQADNVRYRFNEAEHRWTPNTGVYYLDDKTNVDVYGYYPAGRPENVTDYTFTVKTDQSVPASGKNLSAYEESDFLWGKATNIAPSHNPVRITYMHRLSCAKVNLTEGTGFADGEFVQLEKNVLVENVIPSGIIDLSDGTVKPSGEVMNDGIVMMPEQNGFRAIVVPQTVPANTTLFAITVDGVTYKFKKETNFEFIAGKLSQFGITINKKSPSGEYEFVFTGTKICPWIEDEDINKGEARQYYVVNMDKAGTLGEKIRSDKKNPKKIKNIKLLGDMNADDFFYMRDSMDILQGVNLNEVKIKSVGAYSADEIPDNAFDGKKSLTFFAFPLNIIRIGDSAFHNCEYLSGNLIIPNTVTEIDEWAFASCSNLTGLSLPHSLKRICGGAFYCCSSIASNLILPESLIEISHGAFEYCGNITGQLKLPDSLEILGYEAFYGCGKLTGSIKIPEKITVIPYCCFFRCRGLNGQLILNDNITKIEREAFYETSFQGELVLPKKLEIIDYGAFSANGFSSIPFFPESLKEIGYGAFSYCRKLSCILKFNTDLISVGDCAFLECNMLEGMVLPPNLGVLKDGVFRNCYYVNSIKCTSIEPPTVLGSALNGIPKDNFTLEVPEQSVNRYQGDPKWGEFKRITAYRDFSISRRNVQCLTAGIENTFTVRAPMSDTWKVESLPEWVTVTPMDGKGKMDVTVKVQPVEKGTPTRKGEIVFLLEGKDYRVKTKVEQYDYQYGDGDVITLHEATKGNGINVVLLGDCYDAKDISEGMYLNDIQDAYRYLYDVEPYKTYKEYFNVYAVFGLSSDSGVGTVNTIREAKFGSQYTFNGVTPDEKTCFEYACKAPINNDVSKTLIILIPNTTAYGGVTYMWGDGSAIAVCPKSADLYPYDFRGIVQHEAGGHGFGKLADEYIYHNAFISSCSCSCCQHDYELKKFQKLGWYRNVSLTGNMKEVGWSHLIYHPNYGNVVDVFEGAFFHSRGVFRSEPNSCMNNNIPYFSAISRQVIVERIKVLAGEQFSLEEFYAKDVRTMQPVTKSPYDQLSTLSSPSRQQQGPKYMGEKPDFNK